MPTRTRRVRLDDAVTWFLGAWPYEGPHVPTADTVRTYRYQLRWLVGFAQQRGKPYVSDVDDELLRSAFQELLTRTSAQRRSPIYRGGEAACRGLAAATNKLLEWLRRQKLHVADLSHVRAPRLPERLQPRLKPDEFRALEAAVLHQLVEPERRKPRITVARDLALLYLLADTGLRASEVCAMRVGDVSLDRGQIRVSYGKGNKQRALTVLDADDPHGGQTIRLLGEWMAVRAAIAGCRGHDMLWTSIYGSPLNREKLRRVLRALCLAAGLDGNRPPHTFRRGSFTEQYRRNPKEIKVLAARMGWSEKSHHMVSVYTRGADLEFAAEVQVPSMASRWHANL